MAVRDRISIRRVFDQFAALLVQLPVAVLMAVGFQLLCILLPRAATGKLVIVY
jgi:hypothetical protein